jgi:hypothetical protein
VSREVLSGHLNAIRRLKKLEIRVWKISLAAGLQRESLILECVQLIRRKENALKACSAFNARLSPAGKIGDVRQVWPFHIRVL